MFETTRVFSSQEEKLTIFFRFIIMKQICSNANFFICVVLLSDDKHDICNYYAIKRKDWKNFTFIKNRLFLSHQRSQNYGQTVWSTGIFEKIQHFDYVSYEIVQKLWQMFVSNFGIDIAYEKRNPMNGQRLNLLLCFFKHLIISQVFTLHWLQMN